MFFWPQRLFAARSERPLALVLHRQISPTVMPYRALTAEPKKSTLTLFTMACDGSLGEFKGSRAAPRWPEFKCVETDTPRPPELHGKYEAHTQIDFRHPSQCGRVHTHTPNMLCENADIFYLVTIACRCQADLTHKASEAPAVFVFPPGQDQPGWTRSPGKVGKGLTNNCTWKITQLGTHVQLQASHPGPALGEL